VARALTLILAMANPAYVLQVADRLVTRDVGKRRRESVDPLANKCVIYVATDALVAISYTGVAFILGKPTDVWLAGALDADIAAGPRFAFRSGRGSERRITLGAAINRVAGKLSEDLAAMPPSKRGQGVTLQLVGWQWRQRPPQVERPIAWHIVNDGSGKETEIHRLPRYWGWERNNYQVLAAGDRRTKPAEEVVRRLEGRSDLYVEVAEQALVEVIREASESEVTGGGIGADCIAVWLPLADAIRVRYLPAVPAAGYDVYTPWLLMPEVAASAPSVLRGALPNFHLGGLEVAFERVEPYGSTSMGGEMASQERPTDE
jgi:hypothetical protein